MTPPDAMISSEVFSARLPQPVEVDALHHAVPADVGVEDLPDAHGLQVPRQVQRGHVALPHPTPRLDHPVLSVDGDHHAPRPEQIEGPLHESPVLDGAGTQHDLGDHALEDQLERGFGPEAASGFHRHAGDSLGDAPDDVEIPRFPLAGAVEVDDM